MRRWPEVVLRALAKNQVPSSFSMNLLSLHDGREVIVENIDPEKNIEIWIQFLQYSEKNFLPLIHKVLKEINRKTLTLDSLMTIVTNEVENSRTRYSLATKASILDLTAAVSIEDLQEWAHLLYAGFPHE